MLCVLYWPIPLLQPPAAATSVVAFAVYPLVLLLLLVSGVPDERLFTPTANCLHMSVCDAALT